MREGDNPLLTRGTTGLVLSATSEISKTDSYRIFSNLFTAAAVIIPVVAAYSVYQIIGLLR